MMCMLIFGRCVLILHKLSVLKGTLQTARRHC
jgi:hypothetical protein